MNELFYICVELLKWGADVTGMTYEQINVWIFVIIHPLITVFFFITTIYLLIKSYK